MRHLDTRCRGSYRRASDQPLAASYAAVSDVMPAEWRLECNGRFRASVGFGYAQLVEMATHDERLGFGIPLTDFLAEVGLEAGAEVLLIRESNGRTLGIPIRHVLAADAARLTLGTRRAPLESNAGFPVRLDVPGWTYRSDPIAVEALDAIDFSDFVRCL